MAMINLMPSLKTVVIRGSIVAAGVGYALLASPVLAQQPQSLVSVPPNAIDPGGVTNIQSIPNFAVNMLFGVASVLALLYLMYGGIRWITSRGERSAVDAAKKHITAAIIGLVIVFGSFFILRTVGFLTGSNPLQNTFKPFGT